MDVITQTLMDRQIREGLSNAAFAKKYGMSRPTWIAMRKGKSGPSWPGIKKLYRVSPEMLSVIIASITSDQGGAK
jgi:DNA-binding XRE family transcriptional regulator